MTAERTAYRPKIFVDANTDEIKIDEKLLPPRSGITKEIFYLMVSATGRVRRPELDAAALKGGSTVIHDPGPLALKNLVNNFLRRHIPRSYPILGESGTGANHEFWLNAERTFIQREDSGNEPSTPAVVRDRNLFTDIQQRYFDAINNSEDSASSIDIWAPEIYPRVDPQLAQRRVYANLKRVEAAFKRKRWKLEIIDPAEEGLTGPKRYWKSPIEQGVKSDTKPAAITPSVREPTGMIIPAKQPFVAPIFRTETSTDTVFSLAWTDGAEPLTASEFAILARLIDGNRGMISYYIDKGTVDELPNQSIRAVLSKLNLSDNQIKSEGDAYIGVLKKVSTAIAEARNSGQAVRFEDPNMQRIWQYFLTRSTHSRLLGEISEKLGPRITF